MGEKENKPRDQVGVFHKGSWLLDWNGLWDGEVIDRKFSFGGPRDFPVVGDWTGGGSDRIGTFYRGSWKLDWNGNGRWDEFSLNRFISLGGRGDTPVIGDWDCSGSDKVGVFKSRRRRPRWHLDFNGNGVWEGNTGDLIARFGERYDEPVVGDWNGSGTEKIGVVDDGSWLLDYNGNGAWDGETADRRAFIGGTADTPVAGRW